MEGVGLKVLVYYSKLTRCVRDWTIPFALNLKIHVLAVGVPDTDGPIRVDLVLLLFWRVSLTRRCSRWRTAS